MKTVLEKGSVGMRNQERAQSSEEGCLDLGRNPIIRTKAWHQDYT